MRDFIPGYYYPNQIFSDTVYLQNTDPIALLLLDRASLSHYTTDVDIATLSFEELMGLLEIYSTDPFVCSFKNFQKHWPIRQEVLDKLIAKNIPAYQARVINGKKGGRPPAKSAPKPPPTGTVPTGTDASDLFSLAKQVWPQNRIEEDDIYALVGALQEISADQMRAHITAYGKWLETKGDDFLQVMRFSNWIKTGDYERWKTKAAHKPKPQVSDLESTPRTGMRPQPDDLESTPRTGMRPQPYDEIAPYNLLDDTEFQ